MAEKASEQIKHFEHLLNRTVCCTVPGQEQVEYIKGTLLGLYEINGEYAKLPFCTILYADGRSIQVNLGKIIDITDMGPAPSEGETDAAGA